MLDWFARLPTWLKLLGAGAGYLMSTFSGRLPEAYQDTGLWFGFAIGTLFLIGLALHAITAGRGAAKVEPTDLIMLGLGGMVLAAALAGSFGSRTGRHRSTLLNWQTSPPLQRPVIRAWN